MAELGVGGAVTEWPAEVDAPHREETGVEAAVGAEPGSGAVAAEGPTDRGDDAKLAASIGETVAAGDGARFPDLLDQRVSPAHQVQDLVCRDHVLATPPLEVPTSIYSMKRRARSWEREKSTSSRMPSSLYATADHAVELDWVEPR